MPKQIYYSWRYGVSDKQRQTQVLIQQSNWESVVSNVRIINLINDHEPISGGIQVVPCAFRPKWKEYLSSGNSENRFSAWVVTKRFCNRSFSNIVCCLQKYFF